MYFDIDIRALREMDLRFLYSSFVKFIANTTPYNSIDRNVMSAAAHSLMTKMIKNCDAIVAYNPDDLNQIFGYVIGDANKRHLYFIYVKYDFRKLGIGTKLIDAMFGLGDKISQVIYTPSFHKLENKWNLELNSAPISQLTMEGR